jgi:subtilisin family serine protease
MTRRSDGKTRIAALFILLTALAAHPAGAAFLSPNAKKIMGRSGADKSPVVVLYKKTHASVLAPKVQGAPAAVPFARGVAALKAQAAANRPASDTVKARYRGANDLWLVNGYALEVSPAELATLAQDPQVEAIYDNFPVKTPGLIPVSFADSAWATNNWGLGKIAAPEVWDLYGSRGQGVRIGHLDTGVEASHPDLTGKISLWAEFNDFGNRVAGSTPHDSALHGTHTAGVLVGGSNSGGAIGVAPEAKLISAMVLDEQGGSFAQVVAGLQWVMDPDGNPATDDGAHIVSLSLGAPGHYTVFDVIAQDMLAAGVLPVFAIGNDGPGNTAAPGNSVGVLSVGATRDTDAVSSFSGSGDVVVGGVTYHKPEMVAPGQAIYSSIPGGRYRAFSGTSMATPHVAGAAALLKSLQPLIAVDDLKNVLLRSVDDIGPAGADARSGEGRLNVLKAATDLMNMSVIRGTVAKGQGPVPAVITVRGTSNATSRIMKADTRTGQFRLFLPQGSYDVEAQFGSSQSAAQGVSLSQGQVVNVNLSIDGSESSFDSLLVYPNPARPSDGDGAMTFAGLPGDCTVRIYSLSGDLVKEMAPASGDAVWDLTNSGSESVASGLYFYVASHSSSGLGTSTKKGKVAVIR